MPRMKMREPEKEEEREVEKREEGFEGFLEKVGFSPEEVWEKRVEEGPTRFLKEELGPHSVSMERVEREREKAEIEYGVERPVGEMPRKRFNPMEEYGKVAEWIKKGEFPGPEEVAKAIMELRPDDPVRQVLVQDLKLPEKSFDNIAQHIRENFAERPAEEAGFLLWNLNRTALDGPIKKSMFTDEDNNLHVLYRLGGKLIHFRADMSKGELKVDTSKIPEGPKLFEKALIHAYEKFGPELVNVHVMAPGEKFKKLEEAKKLSKVLGLEA